MYLRVDGGKHFKALRKSGGYKGQAERAFIARIDAIDRDHRARFLL